MERFCPCNSMWFAAIKCLINLLAPSDLFGEEQRTRVYSNTLKFIGFVIENIGLNIALSLKQYFSKLPLPALPFRCSPAVNIRKMRWPVVHRGVAADSGAQPSLPFPYR